MILDDPMGRMRKFEWSHEPQENRNHLIAHSGEGHAYRSWALIQYEMRLQACELASLGPCSGPLDKHHVISRATMRGAAEARRFAEEIHPEVFLADVCKRHHDKLGGEAHSKAGRALLIQWKVALFGRPYVEAVLHKFEEKFKARRPELLLDALLADLPSR